MADALPFVQVNIPQGTIGAGTETGSRSVSGEAAEPGLFDSLVAEFSNAGETEAQTTPSAQPVLMEGQMEQAPLQPPVLLSNSVLNLVASMKEELGETLEQPFNSPTDAKLIDALMEKAQALSDKGLLSKEDAGKLTSLLPRLKAARPEGLPALQEEALSVLEELSAKLEPDVLEDLRGQVRDMLSPTPPEQELEPALLDEVLDRKGQTQELPSSNVRTRPTEKRAERPGETDSDDGASGTQGTVEPSPSAFAAVQQPVLQDARQTNNGSEPQEEGLGLPQDDKAVRPEGTDEPQAALLPNGQPRAQRSQQSSGTEAVAQPAQPRAQEPAVRDASAPQGEEAQATPLPEQRAGDGQQSGASRDNGGNPHETGSQGSRGQQPAQASPRRAAGSAPATDEETAPARAERQENNARGVSFQSFFEGVLSSRRTGASPAPMSLTNAQNAAYPQRSEVLRDGLVNVVRFVRADGVRRANVVIDPPALGRISVELTSSTSGVEASIRVSSEQVRQLVQDQLSQLRMTLEQQGVQVTQFAVDVQQDGGERQQGQGQDSQEEDRRRRGRVGAVEEPEENTEEFRVDLEQGMLHWVA